MKITFEKGIPGLEEYKVFEIKEISNNPKFKTINSLDEEYISFIAISPFEVKKDYEIKLNDEIIKELDIKKSTDVMVLNLITLGKSLKESTINLKAPMVINIKNNKGKQLILQHDKYQIKEPLNWSDENVSSK